MHRRCYSVTVSQILPLEGTLQFLFVIPHALNPARGKTSLFTNHHQQHYLVIRVALNSIYAKKSVPFEDICTLMLVTVPYFVWAYCNSALGFLVDGIGV